MRKPIKVIVTHEIAMQTLEDIIITAIEDGSNYWMCFDTETIERAKIIKNKEGIYFSEAIFKMVLLSQRVNILDLETDEFLGTLSLNGIKRGLSRMVKESRSHFLTLEANEGDAETSDVAMQYFVLGEIVFG